MNKDRFRFRFWYKDLKAYMRCVNLDKVFDDKSVIAEQCTGLKDKNGKLIYEGDIIKKDFTQDFEGDYTTPSYYCDCSCIGVVAFRSSTGYFIKNAKVFLTMEKGQAKKLQDKTLKKTRLCARRCEIIGNIHKNADLLKGE